MNTIYQAENNYLNQMEKPEIPDLWYLIFGIILIVFSSFKVEAQDLSFNNLVPASVTVCEGSETFTIEFSNISTETLSNVEAVISLPTGMNYLSSSLSETSNFNVQEANVSNDAALTFSIDDLPPAATVNFTLQADAGFAAYTAQLAGTIFANQITINYNGDSQSETMDAYNILYPALSITQVSSMTNTVFVGQAFTRTITIVNGGYGSLSSFVLKDILDENLSFTAVDLGNLNTNTGEVTFSAADFVGVGNGDGMLDQNEALVVTQTLTAAACNSAQDQLIAYWGCDGQTTGSNIKYPYTTIKLFAPNLSISAQPSLATCFDESADAQQLTITNNGSGPANLLEMEILPNQQDEYTRVDPASIKYELNGVTTSLTPTATQNATGYDCLGANPIDGFTVDLPTIQPGETVYLRWDNYTCTTAYCGNVHFVGWKYESSYTDMCDKNQYSKSGNGQSNQEKNMGTFHESPSDILDGQLATYVMNINTATFKLPEGNGAYFEVVFKVPLGLTWSGNAVDLRYESGTDSWTADQVNYNSTTREIKAKYSLPIPTNFSLTHSHFDLDLTADCSNGGGMVTLGMQLFYVMDASCTDAYHIPMTCLETPQTQIHCPGNCSEGLGFSSFSIERTSFGQSDNDLDGLPDATNQLDFSKVKSKRVMASDTFNTIFTGTIKTSTNFPSWSYAYAKSELPYGNDLGILSAQVNITDQSSGQVLSCSNVPFTTSVTGGIRTVNFDFSPSTLVANGCTTFSGFVLENGDGVELIATYKVTGNIGGNAEQVTVQNDFYVSDTPNGTPYQCNDWNGNFTLVGYYYRVTRAEQYNVKTCTKTLSQTYKMSIGQCCTNYAGGDMFPYEYRNWAKVKTMRVEIPDGYSFVSGSIDQWRTKKVNSKVKESNTITPSSIVGTTHTFDLAAYSVANGGNLNLSDDGFNGKVYLEVAPTCTVNESANLPMPWYFSFQENAVLGGTTTTEYTASADYLKYYRAKLEASTSLPTQEGLNPIVNWDISIKSKNAAADNAWVYFMDASGNIVVEELIDTDNNTTITPVDGFYQLASFGENATRNFTISASYNNCDLSTLKVYTGYNCAAYPTDFNTFPCDYEEMELYIAPQPTELQVRFDSYTNPLDDCDNSIQIELQMLSAKLGAIKDLFVEVIPPANQSVSLESGSTAVLYPLSGAYTTLTDPILQGDRYQITGANMDSLLGTQGLVGVTDITANIVKLKFNLILDNAYQPGEIINFRIGGKRACGDALPTLALAYDPNASFATPENIGLDEISDAWATAWGDYDGDGNVDLFVTNYDPTGPNYLYRNLGTGDFSLVTTGAIATDLASSLAATWGDYDNDGDLDLFVANNIGSENFLYRNLGDGTFVRVLNDPIVTDKGYAHGASWIDYDNDGYLDMFVTDYFSTKFNKLYHNNGDGTFTHAGDAAPSFEANFSVSAAWGDYNNDGYTDLFVANANDENNSLYQNLGNGSFLKINVGDIVNDGGKSVGASWGDYDNDLDLDLFVANAGEQDNFLYQNNGDGTFTRITTGVVATSGGHSHGSAWSDYDNDGDLDLYVSNDQDSDNFLYANQGDGTFVLVANSITQDKGYSFGAAWADYDNDGDVDLFVANHEQNKNFIYQNTRGKCQNKACVLLVGTNSNRSAIGTKIYVKSTIYGTPTWQMREISAQTGGGIGGQNELKTIFGLGDATVVDSIIIEWNSGYRQVMTNQNVNNCFTITEENASEICGVVYYDENSNCVQDSTEIGIPNMKLRIMPGDQYVITQADGSYSFLAAPETYTIEQVAAGTNWTPICTLQKTVTVAGIGSQFCGNNFANEPACALPDLQVGISTTAHRVGFENVIAVNYKNTGTQTATKVKLTVVFGNDIIPLESSLAWDTIIGTNGIWDLGSVPIGTERTIYIKDSISTNVVVGERIDLQVLIEATEGDCNSADNDVTDTQLAVGAIDPNDILVTPEGPIANDQILKYKIRFQNVGNAPVSTVRIEDRLPDNLDIETLALGAASHNYRFEILDGNRLVWLFENINMPDSLANEPESHGYVNFKIYPKKDLTEGASIGNEAFIYFDNMAPIQTNMVMNTIGLPKQTNASGQLRIAPNPMVDFAKIQILDEQGGFVMMKSVRVYDLLGMEVLQYNQLNTDSFDLEKSSLTAGCYLLKVITETGREYAGKVIMK